MGRGETVGEAGAEGVGEEKDMGNEGKLHLVCT